VLFFDFTTDILRSIVRLDRFIPDVNYVMEPLNQQKPMTSLWLGASSLVCALLFFMAAPVPAQETVSTAPVLEPVVVVGTVKVEATGTGSFDKEQIAAIPTSDSSAEELTRLLPGVQISDDSNPSFRGGEILPPRISIAGGRPYENNFLIDGMGNNSLLDPLEDNPNLIDTLPGHPQEIFLNSALVQNVAVYDNNIPARYGNFSGGVVSVETIDPATTFSGLVSYRTTRSDWTKFHIDNADREEFNTSTTYFRQPEFTKHDTGFLVNVPVTETTAILASYQLLYSEIPITVVAQPFRQERKSENVLLKLVSQPTANNKITAQIIYNPYNGAYNTKDTLHSEFNIAGGGTAGKIGYQHFFETGQFAADLGYRVSENSRSAPLHYFSWSNSASKDWGVLLDSRFSKEGGFGSLETNQKTFELNLDWMSTPIETVFGVHHFNLGLNGSRVEGEYDRAQDTYSFNTSVPPRLDPPALVSDPTITCLPGDPACIPGEQFLTRRIVFPAGYAKVNVGSLAGYAEDIWLTGRVEVRPGVRVSYDDFLKNTNIAPRFTGTVDLFGDGSSKLIGGWNRYYSQPLLTYKLREGVSPSRSESRVDNLSPWILSSSSTSRTEFSELETPYSDEIVAGLIQQVLGGTLDLRYVHRENRDQLASERDPLGTLPFRYYRLNNNGRSEYDSLRLKWERHWEKQFLMFNVTYQESTATNENYDEALENVDLQAQIWYKGDLLYPDELPRSDYNRPWVANLIYSVVLPHGFQFTNVANYRRGYENIQPNGEIINVGGAEYDIYADFSLPSSLVFDWKIDWTPPQIAEEPLTLSVEIFNVFNEKATVGETIDEYELGRQFWLGLEYRF